ncbi:MULTISPECIES: hypothetical protein [unclassified Lysobacter]|uniref:hypothetical protein n=1 Tax=unclassified Lysobacter TaxID=2635362 RepID=UPI001C228895|nr:hypothetical protein [Lysobacter sp. MMG2]
MTLISPAPALEAPLAAQKVPVPALFVPSLARAAGSHTCASKAQPEAFNGQSRPDDFEISDRT